MFKLTSLWKGLAGALLLALSAAPALAMDLKFPATEPDQTLCFENKRRIISDKHAAWMAQRERAEGRRQASGAERSEEAVTHFRRCSACREW